MLGERDRRRCAGDAGERDSRGHDLVEGKMIEAVTDDLPELHTRGARRFDVLGATPASDVDDHLLAGELRIKWCARIEEIGFDTALPQPH